MSRAVAKYTATAAEYLHLDFTEFQGIPLQSAYETDKEQVLMFAFQFCEDIEYKFPEFFEFVQCEKVMFKAYIFYGLFDIDYKTGVGTHDGVDHSKSLKGEHKPTTESEKLFAKMMTEALISIIIPPTIILQKILAATKLASTREAKLDALVEKATCETATAKTQVALQDPAILAQPQNLQQYQNLIDALVEKKLNEKLQKNKQELKNSMDDCVPAQPSCPPNAGPTTDENANSSGPSKTTQKRKRARQRKAERKKIEKAQEANKKVKFTDQVAQAAGNDQGTQGESSNAGTEKGKRNSNLRQNRRGGQRK